MAAPKHTHIAQPSTSPSRMYATALCGRMVRPAFVRAEEVATCIDCALAATTPKTASVQQ